MSNFDSVQLRSKKSPVVRCTSTPNNHDNLLAPLILMSGYMTKRTKGLTNKWKKRWWQLLGDGTLIYFHGEERLKLLGEIDIAHTCYDVRLTTNQSEVKFPPIVSPNCCLSISVLKRTYYLYTPTVEEAKKWVDTLSSASYLLNRSRPRSLGYSPAIQVALEAFGQNPQHTLPPMTQPPPLSSPSPPPPESSSFDESNQDEELDEPSALPTFRKLSHSNPKQHVSVPDLRFDMAPYSLNGSWIDGSPRISCRTNSLITRSPPPPPPPPRRRASLRELSNTQNSSDYIFKYKKRNSHTKLTPHTTKTHTGTRYRSHGNLHDWTPSNALPMMIKQQWKNDYEPGFERLEKLQKKEDAIKKRLEEMKKTEMLSFRGNRGPPVLSLPSPTENVRSVYHPRPLSPDISFSMYQPQPEYNHNSLFYDDTLTNNRTTTSKHPKILPKKGPKSGRRKATPAYALLTSSLLDLSTEKEPLEEQVMSLRILDPTESDFTDDDENITPQMGGGKSRHEKNRNNKMIDTNVWGKKELRKLISEINRHGYMSSRGKMEIRFIDLVENTNGIFESLLGTLLTARKQKIIDFDGDILLKGEHDDTIITLLKSSI